MYNLSIKNIILAIGVTSLSSVACSQDISYDYIQGAYSSTTIDLGDGFDLDGDGLAVTGSFSVNNNIAISAGYSSTGYDKIAGISIDTTGLAIGLIAHTKITPTTDLFGGVTLFNGEFELSDGFTTLSEDDTGNILSAGVRSMVTNNLELNFSGSRIDIFDETDNAISFGAQFYANEKLSLGVSYVTAEDVDSLVFNVRIDM